MVIIYFMNQEIPVFNLESMKENLYLSEEEIMKAFSRLVGIKLISVVVKKNEKGVREEHISLDTILQYATTDITKKAKSASKTNLLEEFEKEFGRTLSPMECQIINGWGDLYSEELIKEALKETIYNGVKSLRYVNGILVAWKDKGYKNKEDVTKAYSTGSDDTLGDLFDYDWLDDNNE